MLKIQGVVTVLLISQSISSNKYKNIWIEIVNLFSCFYFFIEQEEVSPTRHIADDIAKPAKVKNPIFEDEEKAKLLQKLLQSKDPFDLKLANKLIKTMVKDVRT